MSSMLTSVSFFLPLDARLMDTARRGGWCDTGMKYEKGATFTGPPADDCDEITATGRGTTAETQWTAIHFKRGSLHLLNKALNPAASPVLMRKWYRLAVDEGSNLIMSSTIQF